MPNSDPVDQSLAEVSKYFVGDKAMLDTLHRLATLAVDAIEPAEYCGLTMLIDGDIGTGVFTDPEAPEIDKAQYESGAGPCLDAFRTGEIFRVESTAADGPWPEFGEHVCSAVDEHCVVSDADRRRSPWCHEHVRLRGPSQRSARPSWWRAVRPRHKPGL